MPDPLGRVLPLLEAVKKVGGGYEARCPAHDDTEPSLSVKVGTDGRLLMHCHRGCEPEVVVGALGLSLRDLFPATNGHKAGASLAKASRMAYELLDEKGELVATHVRIDPASGKKKMWWERGGRKGLGDLKLEQLPLYGVERLAGVEPGTPVIVTEGEKAAESLMVMGLHAVGTVTGASHGPGREALAPLIPFDIVLWPDNDPPGRSHMDRVAATLAGMRTACRLMQWADAPEKGDAADFVEAGLGRDRLNEMYAEAILWQPSDQTIPTEPTVEELLHLTDMGNARRLVTRYEQSIRWARQLKRWMAWDNGRWIDGADEAIQRYAKETVMSIYDEAIAATSDERYEALRKHAVRSESSRAVSSMIALAPSEDGIGLSADELDKNLYLFNCKNGTIDLRTGELSAAAREDYITKQAPVEYDEEAPCDLFRTFLNRIFADDTEMIRFIQRSVGYCLSGLTVERVMFILYGVGRNGKTTLLEVLGDILGDYAMGTPASTLMARRDKGIPNDVARLKGARFVPTSETSEGELLDEAFIKAATGGDTLRARFLHAEWFEFRPQFKIWLATNHRPAIKGTDPAVWDRIRLIPFAVRIPEEETDKGLRAKLLAESPGILAWAVRGFLDWQKTGSLGEPQSVLDATRAYKQEEDILGGFIEECCVTSKAVSATGKDLYKAYRDWADRAGEEAVSQTRFGTRLRERGFHGQRSTGGKHIWRGIRPMGNEQAVADFEDDEKAT